MTCSVYISVQLSDILAQTSNNPVSTHLHALIIILLHINIFSDPAHVIQSHIVHTNGEPLIQKQRSVMVGGFRLQLHTSG